MKRFVIRSEVAQIGVFSLLQYLYLSINKNFSTINEFLVLRESAPILVSQNNNALEEHIEITNLASRLDPRKSDLYKKQDVGNERSVG